MSRKLPKPRRLKLRYPEHAIELRQPRVPRTSRNVQGYHIVGEALTQDSTSHGSGRWTGEPDGSYQN